MTQTELVIKVLDLQKYIRSLTTYIEDLESKVSFQTALDNYKSTRHKHHKYSRSRSRSNSNSHSVSDSSTSTSSATPIQPLLIRPPPPPSSSSPAGLDASPPFPPLPSDVSDLEAAAPPAASVHVSVLPLGQVRRARHRGHTRRASAVKTTYSRTTTPRLTADEEARLASTAAVAATVFIDPKKKKKEDSKSKEKITEVDEKETETPKRSEVSSIKSPNLHGTMRIKITLPPQQPPPSPPLQDEDTNKTNTATAATSDEDTEIHVPLTPAEGPLPLVMDDDDDDDELIIQKQRKDTATTSDNDKTKLEKTKKIDDDDDEIHGNNDESDDDDTKHPFGDAAVATAKIDSDGDNAASFARPIPTKSPRLKKLASSAMLPLSGGMWQQQQQQQQQQSPSQPQPQPRHRISNTNKNVTIGTDFNIQSRRQQVSRHQSKTSFSSTASSAGTPPNKGLRMSLLIPQRIDLKKMSGGGYSTPQKVVTPSRQQISKIMHDGPQPNSLARTVFVPFQDEL